MTRRLVSIFVMIESYFYGASQKQWEKYQLIVIFAMRNGCLHNQHHSMRSRNCYLA